MLGVYITVEKRPSALEYGKSYPPHAVAIKGAEVERRHMRV